MKNIFVIHTSSYMESDGTPDTDTFAMTEKDFDKLVKLLETEQEEGEVDEDVLEAAWVDRNVACTHFVTISSYYGSYIVHNVETIHPLPI